VTAVLAACGAKQNASQSAHNIGSTAIYNTSCSLPYYTTMKLSLASPLTLLFALALSRGANAAGIWPRPPTAIMNERRHLGDDLDSLFNFFLVSHISYDKAWCITAAEGTNDLGELLLQPCELQSGPLNQLWIPTLDGKIRSALDDNKCITINHGTNLFPSARARLTDCSSGLSEFIFEDGQIKVADDDRYCLTNRGPIPHPTDYIHAKKCIDRKDFYWEPFPNISFFVQLASGGGCAQPREGAHRIYLDPCDEEIAWRVEIIAEDLEIVLLHSAFDDTMCLRAGRAESSAVDGTRMTLAPCDTDDPLQQVELGDEEDTIHLGGNLDLCMVYRGTVGNVGSDPIIMKNCSPDREPWDIIDLFDFEV
jgi:hypothetical protein